MARAHHNALGDAHRGYLYQDAATALVVLWGLYHEADEVVVDRKAYPGDLFDDITVRSDGRVLCRQYKSSADPAATFSAEHLRTKISDLRIDDLVNAYKQAGPDPADEYRVCATWRTPTDPADLDILEPSDAAGSFSDWLTRRWRLRPDAVWPAGGELVWKLRDPRPMTRGEFVAFADRFVIELECPQITPDRINPGPLELLVEDFLATRIGVGRYPNAGRSVRDVADRLMRWASQARASHASVVPGHVLGALGIRTDLGRVAQRFPVITAEQVTRWDVLGALEARVRRDPLVVVVGSPGCGKSWLLTELGETLAAGGALVARHYCYIQPGDGDRELRITSDALFANLMAELADVAPGLRRRATARYAAGPAELAEVLCGALEAHPSRRVVLIVDGLDHITRVACEAAAVARDRFDILDRLADFPWPERVTLVLGSQPGEHLRRLAERCEPIAVPGWSPGDIRALACGAGLPSSLLSCGFSDVVCAEAVKVLSEKAEGNPLYASFLCRQMAEAARSGELTDPPSLLRGAPTLGGDLGNYYRHLLGGGGPDAVAEALAHLDFAVTLADLRAIFPILKGQVEASVRRLAPVLTRVTAQGGVRVYHESFRRYVVEDRLTRGGDRADMLRPVTDWLEGLGVFDDARSYRFLLGILHRAGDGRRALALVGPDFVTRSVAGGHPEAAVRHNLAVAADLAAGAADWPSLAGVSELLVACEVCFEQKLDPRPYARALAALRGPDRLVGGLVFDGKPTHEREHGLLLCAIADDLGAAPPWEEYLGLPERNRGEAGHAAEARAVCRGRLATDPDRFLADTAGWLGAGTDQPAWYARIAAEEIARTGGGAVLARLVDGAPGAAAGARGEFVAALVAAELSAGDAAAAAERARGAVAADPDVRTAWRYALAGVPVEGLPCQPPDVRELSAAVAPGRHHQDGDGVARWAACVGLLSRTSPADLEAVRDLVAGEGWYAAWLEFVIDLSLAETRGDSEAGVVAALDRLARVAAEYGPFAGTPRACDVYPIRDSVHEVWERAIALLRTPAGWEAGVGHLEDISGSITTSLFNHPGGPLSPDELTELLVPHLDAAVARPAVLRVIRGTASTAQRSYYETEAVLQLRATVALARAGETAEAEEQWSRACVRLGGYGFRKDATIYELIDSLPALLVAAPEFVRAALRRVQPLVWELDTRTDGRGTGRAIVRWFGVLWEADPVAAATVLARALSAQGGAVYWRLEECLSELSDRLPAQADPRVVFAVLQTAATSVSPSYVGSCLSLVRRIRADDEPTADAAFARLCARVIDGTHGPVDPELVGELARYAGEHGLLVPEPSAVQPPDDPPAASPFAPGAGHLEEEPAPPFELSPGARAADVAAALGAGVSVGPRAPTDAVADQLGPWIVRQLGGGDVEGVRGVVSTLVTTYRYGERGELLARLARSAERGGQPAYAAELYALAHVHAGEDRWNRGWCRDEPFAGLSHATQLGGLAVLGFVAAEMGRLAQDGFHPVCRARHLVPLCVWSGSADRAVDVWERTFAAVSHRIPEPGGTPGHCLPHYVPGAGAGWGPDEALCRLVLARVDHPDAAVKRAALTGLGVVLSACPEHAVRGLREAFDSQTPLTSLLLIIQTLWLAERPPYVATRALRGELERAAGSDLPALNAGVERLLERAEGGT